MKARQAVSNADSLRPNSISDDIKAGWLHEIDTKAAQFIGIEDPENKWPDDYDLVIPEPYSEVYELYLCCRIDNAQMETAVYEDDRGVYQAAWQEWTAWWRRHNRPKKTGGWRVGL